MTEFNIKSLPNMGGVELTDDDLNVIRKNNLDNCFIVTYNKNNYVKIYPNQDLLNMIKNFYETLNIVDITNIFIKNIAFSFKDNIFTAYLILVEFWTQEGYIIKQLEL